MPEDVPTDARGQWRALLRRPGYRGFVTTVSASRIVGSMFNIAGVLLVLDRTGSAPLAGVVAAATVLPGALTGPLLGAWLDVARSRRALIVVDQLISVVALVAIVALAGHGPDWTLPVVAMLYSVTRPFSTGSFVSALAAIAGPGLLDRASTVEATSMNLAIVVGPALAGALAGALGAAEVVELQAALTVLVALVIAVSPSFEARSEERVESISEALREGTRALVGHRLLRDTAAASLLASFSWGLMLIAFPLYAERSLHTGRNAGGYLWAAVALGSIIGTFALAGGPSRRRVGRSYLVLGLSALLWTLAGSLWVGFALIAFSGVLEGPAYSGSIALRQRHAPVGARTQVLNTIAGFNQVALSAGSILGGVLRAPVAAFVCFCAVNLAAAAIVGQGELLRPRPARAQDGASG